MNDRANARQKSGATFIAILQAVQMYKLGSIYQQSDSRAIAPEAVMWPWKYGE